MKTLHSLAKIKLRLLFWPSLPHFYNNSNIPCTMDNNAHHGCAQRLLGDESDGQIIIYCECDICNEDNEVAHYFKRVSGYICSSCFNDSHPVQP